MVWPVMPGPPWHPFFSRSINHDSPIAVARPSGSDRRMQQSDEMKSRTDRAFGSSQRVKTFRHVPEKTTGRMNEDQALALAKIAHPVRRADFAGNGTRMRFGFLPASTPVAVSALQRRDASCL